MRKYLINTYYDFEYEIETDKPFVAYVAAFYLLMNNGILYHPDMEVEFPMTQEEEDNFFQSEFGTTFEEMMETLDNEDLIKCVESIEVGNRDIQKEAGLLRNDMMKVEKIMFQMAEELLTKLKNETSKTIQTDDRTEEQGS